MHVFTEEERSRSLSLTCRYEQHGNELTCPADVAGNISGECRSYVRLQPSLELGVSWLRINDATNTLCKLV